MLYIVVSIEDNTALNKGSFRLYEQYHGRSPDTFQIVPMQGYSTDVCISKKTLTHNIYKEWRIDLGLNVSRLRADATFPEQEFKC